MSDSPVNQTATIEPPAPPTANSDPAPFPTLTTIACKLSRKFSVVDVTLAIANQDQLAQFVYRQLQALFPIDFELTEANFTRMWKTLLLKRVQDVYEKSKYRRADNYVQLGMPLSPAPLGDLLHNIGSYYCDIDGVNYHIVPPARATPAPDWWTLDDNILSQWHRLMYRASKYYLMREFPQPNDYKGRSIVLCSRDLSDNDTSVSVNAKYSCISPSDGLITAVNDNLFDPVPFAFADSQFIVMTRQNLAGISADYVGSCVLNVFLRFDVCFLC